MRQGAYTLYHEPATPFVGEFIGQGQLIDATVSQDGQFLETEFGNVTCSQYLPNTRLQLLSRPDDWRLDHNGDKNTSNVRILGKQFVGTQTLYQVSNQQQSLTVAASSHMQADIGEDIFIQPDFSHIITFNA